MDSIVADDLYREEEEIICAQAMLWGGKGRIYNFFSVCSAPAFWPPHYRKQPIIPVQDSFRSWQKFLKGFIWFILVHAFFSCSFSRIGFGEETSSMWRLVTLTDLHKHLLEACKYAYYLLSLLCKLFSFLPTTAHWSFILWIASTFPCQADIPTWHPSPPV